MMLMIDGPMITRFVSDVDNFNKIADDQFHELDTNGVGHLTRQDLANKLSGSEEHRAFDGKEENFDDVVFDKFDIDGNGKIDGEEFRLLMAEMLMAMARGIGPMPVFFAVEEDSLLLKAYEYELERIDRKLDEVIESNGIQVVRKDRDLKKKKKSMKSVFGIGCCNSERYLGKD